MIRKIVVMLLTGVMCLVGMSPLFAAQVVTYGTIEEYKEAVGRKIEKFDEAPMLKEKVAIGELPLLGERLPEEPLVVQPAEKIGEYGGVLRSAHMGYLDFLEDFLREFPFMYSNDLQEIKPNIFKGYEVSEDGRTFVFQIRKGIRWSDGYPFTADDVVFWYEDIALNKELKPGGVSFLKIAGEMGVVEKIGDYAVKFSFLEPYGVLVEKLCRWRPVPYAPKHYLKQFHPNYTSKDELDKMVKAEGFDSWVSLFEHERYYPDNPKVPTICAWQAVTRFSEPVHRFVRNPYYWKIDTAGNQLPYTDEVNLTLVGDSEGLLMKVLAGDLDYMDSFELNYETNYPVLKKNEKQGNYRLNLQYGYTNNYGYTLFNHSHEDSVLREIFTDKTFRIALSVAMNRDEINNVVFKGIYIPSQPATEDGPLYHGELPQFHVYTQYDPQLANHLLDTIGLKWDKDHNVRLRPDGKPLQLVVIVNTNVVQLVPIMEMYKKYWEDVGVQITIKPLSQDFFYQRIRSGQYDMGVTYVVLGGTRPWIPAMRSNTVPIEPNWDVNPPWAAWLLSEGEKGEEPPEGVKRLFEISKEFMAEIDVEKRTALQQELFMIWCDNLWSISGLKRPSNLPQIFYSVINNRVKNVPEPCAMEWYYAVPSSWSIEE